MGEREDAWRDLVEVHSDLKSKFKYVSDMDLYNKSEFWAVMAEEYKGDCEDFALTCRQMLISKGWDRSSLRPACCWTETGGYHAVLVAEVEGSAYVLDNRQKKVVPWNDLPYKWDKILSKDGKNWMSISA